jgi:hypothetical protein
LKKHNHLKLHHLNLTKYVPHERSKVNLKKRVTEKKSQTFCAINRQQIKLNKRINKILPSEVFKTYKIKMIKKGMILKLLKHTLDNEC